MQGARLDRQNPVNQKTGGAQKQHHNKAHGQNAIGALEDGVVFQGYQFGRGIHQFGHRQILLFDIVVDKGCGAGGLDPNLIGRDPTGGLDLGQMGHDQEIFHLPIHPVGILDIRHRRIGGEIIHKAIDYPTHRFIPLLGAVIDDIPDFKTVIASVGGHQHRPAVFAHDI